MNRITMGSRIIASGSQKPILVIDAAGHPSDWVTIEDAVTHYAKGNVAWEAGEHFFDMRGGRQRSTGELSLVRANSIIAITGAVIVEAAGFGNPAVGLTSDGVKMRDLNVCAYCSEVYRKRDLSLDHIHPESRGGQWTWMNLVTACMDCNSRKGNRTPEEAGMPLVYVPYIPNRFERFILRQRNILADQMQYLLAGVSRESRLLSH